MSKIYTCTGDLGTSSIPGSPNISKSSLIFDVLGTLDELNVTLGIARNYCTVAIKRVTNSCGITNTEEVPLKQYTPDIVANHIWELQKNIITLSGFFVQKELTKKQLNWFNKETVKIEKLIDDISTTLPELNSFIISGDSALSCYLHMARVVCRRTERVIVEYFESVYSGTAQRLHNNSGIAQVSLNNSAFNFQSGCLKYINRLSDLLFVLARIG